VIHFTIGTKKAGRADARGVGGIQSTGFIKMATI
jgi:hypothetical protein